PLVGLLVEGARRRGNGEVRDRCTGGGEAELGVAGEVPDEGDDGFSSHGRVLSGSGTQLVRADREVRDLLRRRGGRAWCAAPTRSGRAVGPAPWPWPARW